MKMSILSKSSVAVAVMVLFFYHDAYSLFKKKATKPSSTAQNKKSTSSFSARPTTPVSQFSRPAVSKAAPRTSSSSSAKPATFASRSTIGQRPGSPPPARPATPAQKPAASSGGGMFGGLFGGRQPAAPARGSATPGAAAPGQQQKSGGMLGGLFGSRAAAPAPGSAAPGAAVPGQQQKSGGIGAKLSGLFSSIGQKVVAKVKEVGNEAILFFKALPGALKQFAIEMKNQFQQFNLNTTELRLVIKVPINPNQPGAAQGQATQPGANQPGSQQKSVTQPGQPIRPPLPSSRQTSGTSRVRR